MTTQLLDTLRRIGITPPPNLAAFSAIESRLQSVMTADAGTTRRDFRELVAHGTDPEAIMSAYENAVDAEMRRAASAAVLAEIQVPLRNGAGRAVQADADVLWPLLVDRFAELGAQLADAVAIIGTDPDPAAIAKMGTAAQDALIVYREVSNHLGHVLGAIKQVAAARRERTPLPMSRYVDPEQLAEVADIERANACEGGPVYGFAALLAAGFTLKLSTAVEHAAAVELARANAEIGSGRDEDTDADRAGAVATVRRVR